MDLFIQAFISFGSYLMLTYFIYSILNRNRTIPLFIFGFLLVSEIIQLVSWINLGAGFNIILYGMMRHLLPVVLAFLIFLRLSGGFGLPKIKRATKMKSINTDVQTTYQTKVVSLVLGGLGLIFSILSYFLMTGFMKWVILVFGLVIGGFGLYIFIKQKKIVIEKVILIIGRDKKAYYTYDIPQHTMSVTIQEFFKNEDYIVDPIGKIILTDHERGTQIYYIYWIATNDVIDMSTETQLMKTSIPFENILDHFEKYHYRIIHVQEDEKGNRSIVSNKKIK
jgi:hypothetical protein